MEEAFYTTDRVMTVSFHKYGEYFPGTGDLRVSYIGDVSFAMVNAYIYYYYLNRILGQEKENTMLSTSLSVMGSMMKVTNKYLFQSCPK